MIAENFAVSTTPVLIVPKGRGTITNHAAFALQASGAAFLGGPNVDTANNGFPITALVPYFFDAINEEVWAVATGPVTISILRRSNA